MTAGLVAVLALGLFAAAVEAKPRKKKPKGIERTQEWEYQAPAFGSGTGVCLRPTNSCADFVPVKGEKFMTVEITDATGVPVYFSVAQDTDPDAVGSEKDLGEFCGKTEKPIKRFATGAQITVFPWSVGSSDCPGIATQGVVTATFSNRK
ncbi:MAG: hypothetical protein ACRDKZ_09585 [Actinomycetota bacterium]